MSFMVINLSEHLLSCVIGTTTSGYFEQVNILILLYFFLFLKNI